MEITWTYNWLESIAVIGMSIIGFIIVAVVLVKIVAIAIIKTIFRSW
jgi:hypothetical protein